MGILTLGSLGLRHRNEFVIGSQRALWYEDISARWRADWSGFQQTRGRGLGRRVIESSVVYKSP